MSCICGTPRPITYRTSSGVCDPYSGTIVLCDCCNGEIARTPSTHRTPAQKALDVGRTTMQPEPEVTFESLMAVERKAREYLNDLPADLSPELLAATAALGAGYGEAIECP